MTTNASMEEKTPGLEDAIEAMAGSVGRILGTTEDGNDVVHYSARDEVRVEDDGEVIQETSLNGATRDEFRAWADENAETDVDWNEEVFDG
jgi:hypothetical protein